MYLAISQKHSSIESKPENEPYRENHGVQMCAGIIRTFSSHSRAICARSRLEIPTIGLPSDLRFAFLSKSFLLNLETDASDGKKKRLWIRLPFPPWL